MNDYYKAPTRKQYDDYIAKLAMPRRISTTDSAAFLFKTLYGVGGFFSMWNCV